MKTQQLEHEFAPIAKRGHLTVVKTKVQGKTVEKEVFVEADLSPHNRPRVGETAREWAANPNKEEHRISRLRSRSAAHIEAKTGRKVK